MNESVKILFGLFGGLAIFIFGMNMMSECLQKAAGDKMKKILSMLARNPLLGVLAGAVAHSLFKICGIGKTPSGNGYVSEYGDETSGACANVMFHYEIERKKKRAHGCISCQILRG